MKDYLWKILSIAGLLVTIICIYWAFYVHLEQAVFFASLFAGAGTVIASSIALYLGYKPLPKVEIDQVSLSSREKSNFHFYQSKEKQGYFVRLYLEAIFVNKGQDIAEHNFITLKLLTPSSDIKLFMFNGERISWERIDMVSDNEINIFMKPHINFGPGIKIRSPTFDIYIDLGSEKIEFNKEISIEIGCGARSSKIFFQKFKINNEILKAIFEEYKQYGFNKLEDSKYSKDLIQKA